MPGLQVCCMLGNVAFWSSSERFFLLQKIFQQTTLAGKVIKVFDVTFIQ